MRLSNRFALTIGSFFLIAAVLVIVLVNYNQRGQALVEARAKALLILDHNLATHTYFSHDLKPKLFEFTEPLRLPGYFEPTWMSSTYAVREIERHFRPLSKADYYYKECAINARSPLNEADEFERSFIEELNADPDLESRSLIRTLDGRPYFVTLRRGEMMEQSCLRCHSTPERAPAEMVSLYGPERSYSRREGEVVSAISIRVPLAEAYARVNMISFKLSGLMLVILLTLFIFINRVNRKQIVDPISDLKDKALLIAGEEKHLGEEIPLPESSELAEMTTAFNRMSSQLRQNIDQLEDRVRERTHDLQEALDQVKVLSGFLPICASCKKIRDDKGYWSQIEEYISDRSEAEFSHGICPDCAIKLYP